MTTEKKVKEPMTREEYCDEVGVLCPSCRSDNIESVSDLDGDKVAGDVWQTMKCLKCGKEWIACYSLTGYLDRDNKKIDPRNVRVTASDNFIMYVDAIKQQLDTLTVLTNKHFGYAIEEVHWGHTGSAQYLCEQLSEVIISLDGFPKK